jgi:hypothetical protein
MENKTIFGIYNVPQDLSLSATYIVPGILSNEQKTIFCVDKADEQKNTFDTQLMSILQVPKPKN